MTLDELFDLVDSLPRDEKGCRIYPNLKSEKDYPTVVLPNIKPNQRVSRIILARKLGRLLKPMYHALHTCDRPNCVEASHLWEGTNLDNIKDCVVKGRHWTKTHPEKRAFWDRNGSRKHPENYPKGNDHWAHNFPEKRPKGEKHGAAILTEEQARTILHRYATENISQSQLGDEYGVGQMTISKLVRRITWRHLDC